MILETKYASGKSTVRYKKNTGYSNHRELFDDLKDFQQQRDGERGNRTLGDFVFYRCHEFLVLLSKPYKHRA